MKFTMGKKVVALTGAAAMLVSVAACGNSSNSADNSSDASSSGDKVELNVWAWEPTLTHDRKSVV